MENNDKEILNKNLHGESDWVTMCYGDVFKTLQMERNKYLALHKSPITQGKGKDKRFFTYLPDSTSPYGRRIIRKPTQEEVENEVIRYYKEKMEAEKKAKISTKVTVSEFFLMWIEYASERPNISTETIHRYGTDYNRFIRDSDFGRYKVKDIDYVDIEDFLIESTKKFQLKKTALGNLYGYLKNMMSYAMRKRLIKENPCSLVDMKNVRPYCDTSTKKAQERILSDYEIKALLDTVHEHQKEYPLYMADYAIEICLNSGLRVGEVSALRWDCINDGVMYITKSEHRVRDKNGVSSYIIGAPKNKKERTVPVNQKLKEIFERIHNLQIENHIQSEYILADLNGRVISSTISKAMYRRGVEAGITAKSIHAIRRTVASKLNTKLPRATVSLIMGHTDVVDEQFYDYDTLKLTEKINAMDSLLEKIG